jgi:hypothetical protein
MSRNVHADLMIQAANDTSIKWDFSRDGVTWTGTASPTWLVELQYRQKPQSQQEMKDAQSTVNSITAALAQPEPAPVLWVMTTPIGGKKFVIESESEAKRFAAMDNRSVVPFYSAPDTYRNPADDAALKRLFEAMENEIVAELRSELADMTAQRDDLLAALRSLLKWGHATATIYKAEAAIKKATGGQP